MISFPCLRSVCRLAHLGFVVSTVPGIAMRYGKPKGSKPGKYNFFNNMKNIKKQQISDFVICLLVHVNLLHS